MKILNRDVDYAARALVLMARANKPMVPVAVMRKEIGVAGPFLRKIMQKLHKAGLVQAVKGKGGGFALARGPQSISLGELVTALQGPIRFNDCVFKKKLCARHDICTLRRRLTAMEDRLAEEMYGITLLDLV